MHIALYRRLRPITFSAVFGQEHITKTLQNQLRHDKVSHAYLFCGTRGTGKTTMAKLLARAVNCESRQDGEPCNACHSCRAILEQRSLNVLEIDAASNTGVDNIREIRDEIQYPPAEGRYKVYIIDEVHMLSAGAFNAMLKTLEEPPDHVIFILATTDPQKIPVTIHSRCQRFDFKRVSASEMFGAISGYVESEKLEITEDALKYIISIADGSMRDALSLLERCILFYEGGVTREKVLEITGSVDKRTCFELTHALCAGDSSSCIEIIERINNDGRDFYQFTTDMITHFRNLLVSLSIHGSGSSALDYSEENVDRLSKQAQTAGRDRLFSLLSDFSALQVDMKYADMERILLEVCCIKICRPATAASPQGQSPASVPRPETADLAVLSRLDKLEREFAEAKKPGSAPSKAKPASPAHKVAKPGDIDWAVFVKKHGKNELVYLQKTELTLVDGMLYLICDNIVSTNVLKKKEDEIKSLLASEQGDPGVITFIDRRDYNRKFGISAQTDEDADFESLRKSMGL